MTLIHPITLEQQRQVVAETESYIQRASQLAEKPFSLITVRFNLRGSSAGMYRVRGDEREIRYNPYLFAKYFDDSLANTVPHEVAHYIVDCLYGLKRVRPHGREWQQWMLAFGAEPEVTCRYDMSGVPQRRQQRFEYRCACRCHHLTATRHNKVLRGLGSYQCKMCGQPLEPVS